MGNYTPPRRTFIRFDAVSITQNALFYKVFLIGANVETEGAFYRNIHKQKAVAIQNKSVSKIKENNVKYTINEEKIAQ